LSLFPERVKRRSSKDQEAKGAERSSKDYKETSCRCPTDGGRARQETKGGGREKGNQIEGCLEGGSKVEGCRGGACQEKKKDGGGSVVSQIHCYGVSGLRYSYTC
jgi:hypothetical protein